MILHEKVRFSGVSLLIIENLFLNLQGELLFPTNTFSQRTEFTLFSSRTEFMANKKLRIPYGKTDFAEIRREGYYYVDKTRFIAPLEEEGNFVFFLRPRRFGKSLMLNVIQAYYDVNYADQFEELFGGLDAGKNPTEKHNTYLVLKFNFSAVNPKKEKVMESFNEKVLYTLQNFVGTYASYLPDGTLEELRQIRTCDIALNYVLGKVKMAKLQVYLLIDEYDNFANTMMAEDEDDYTDLTHGDGFFRLFFNILKEATTDLNAAIGRMFITGVTPLTLSDVTSGFNIGDNFSMERKYNEMIGFTESEVRTMLEYYRDQTGVFRHTVDELIEVMKPWYNNNCFSSYCIEDERMFNSDMTLYFLNKYIGSGGHIPENMIDMNVRSDYNKMRLMVKLDKSFGEKGRVMQEIFSDRGIDCKVSPEFSIYELQETDNLPSMLYYMGLLTYGTNAEGDTILVIPNQVVFEQYYRYMDNCYQRFLNWQTDINTVNRLAKQLVRKGNAQPLLDYLCHQITTDSSNRDFDPMAESFIKGFLLAKLGGTNNSYLITTTEPEENHGYSDLYMEPWNNDCKHSFLVELKYCKHGSSDAEVQQKYQDALDQLEKYAADKALQLKAEGNGWTLHKFAIVFRGWEVQVCEEVG